MQIIKALRFIALSLIKFMIYFYKYIISPILPNSCRFLPTCSQYSLEAFEKHGIIKGFTLTFRRVKRCHPLGDSGFDPVP